jgi:S1-C subfamily serine protease
MDKTQKMLKSVIRWNLLIIFIVAIYFFGICYKLDTFVKGFADGFNKINTTMNVWNSMINDRQTIDLENLSNLRKANLLITNWTQNWEGSGTHIKIEDKSYILTVAHLIKEKSDEIVARDNLNTYPLRVIDFDTKKDIALLEFLVEPDLPHLEIALSNPLEGSKVHIIANFMYGTDVVLEGAVMQFKDSKIWVTSSIAPGMSGGGIIYKGKLVGVVTGDWSFTRMTKYTFDYQSYGIGVDLKNIKDFLINIELEETINE